MNEFSEDKLIEQTAVNLIRDEDTLRAPTVSNRIRIFGETV